MPPSEDLVIPPPPGTAQHSASNEDRIGGFTPPPMFRDEPRLPAAPADHEDLTLPPILPTGSGAESPVEEANKPLADQDLETLGETEPVPLRSFLRKPTAQPVELDSSLFLLELQADILEEQRSDSEQVAEDLEDLPVAIEIPQPAKAPRSLVVVDDIPQPDKSTSAQQWPKGGVPLDIAITPGPVVPKWSPYGSYRNYAAPPAALPRRLATSNSDWDLRPIE